MPLRPNSALADDVCAASAAYLFNLLPDLVKLPAPEQFQRLAAHFEAALLAYHDGINGWLPEPSQN
ncbi:hypothetical protein [Frigoriglobus tundricola]|uniref:Uncharacterized protein n=1 Tax=Frigoriglobus tundricola TaxID=2774151 RepID=A0A6M5YJQ9_9BACT|nr:hypothetical protein [Frigoriglobus tundricola]QJW94195.1 hypothetical protein FTUN_1714 [Frigoriglobus tundricola]